MSHFMQAGLPPRTSRELVHQAKNALAPRIGLGFRLGQIADAAALEGVEGIKMRMRNAPQRILKREEGAREVWPRVPLEFEQHWFGPTLDPNPAADDSLDAIINLATHDAVMNAKSHAPRMCPPLPGDNTKIASASGPGRSRRQDDGTIGRSAEFGEFTEAFRRRLRLIPGAGRRAPAK